MDDSHLQIVADELADARYDALSVEAARQKLMQPESSSEMVVIPAEFTITEIMGSVSQETIGRLIAWPHLRDLRDKIVAQDRAGVLTWGQMLAVAGLISAEELAAITTLLGRTSEIERRTYGQSRFSVIANGVAGFPNAVTEAEFSEAWQLAGR